LHELIPRPRGIQAQPEGDGKPASQSDAIEIEAGAKRRLADEYDAAQECGEVVGPNDGQHIAVPNGNGKATAEEIGLSRKDIHEARIIRDAEKADPGITRRTLDAQLAAGEEPTKGRSVSRGCVVTTVCRLGRSNPETRTGAAPGRRRGPMLRPHRPERPLPDFP
jgi:hypothetical protein